MAGKSEKTTFLFCQSPFYFSCVSLGKRTLIAAILPCYNVGEKSLLSERQENDANVLTDDRPLIPKNADRPRFSTYPKSLRQGSLRNRVSVTEATRNLPH